MERALGKLGKDFMVLIGVSNDDTKEVADKMVKKMLGLRILKMNRENQSVTGCSRRRTSSHLSVYIICKLQERKPAKLHRSRSTGYGLGNV